MKRTFLCLLALISILAAQAQSKEQKPEKKTRKFHVGLSYSYMNTDMKLNSLSIHSVWQGQDFGTNDLTDDEIDDINSFVTRTSKVNCISLEAGMVLLSKPDVKWFIEGSIVAGIANNYTRIYNEETGKEEQTFNSGYGKPLVGLNFDFSYHFTPHWGLSLRPILDYSWGTAKDIKDESYPPLENYTETRKDQFLYLYHRANLLATYTVKNFKISAGPGFYMLYATHKYTIERTNNEAGYVLMDEFNSSVVSTTDIDAVIGVEWRIIDALTLSAFGAFGNDLVIHGGLNYNF
jgi:hypothetical protein